jgi:hypothetical protein
MASAALVRLVARLLERREIRVPDVSDDWLNDLATESPKHTDEG